jgi:hypothetical protein|tara:strand:- start:358 stop:612 length:255 start_codon:yes stop_codon:yes gene_type:complete
MAFPNNYNIERLADYIVQFQEELESGKIWQIDQGKEWEGWNEIEVPKILQSIREILAAEEKSEFTRFFCCDCDEEQNNCICEDV